MQYLFRRVGGRGNGGGWEGGRAGKGGGWEGRVGGRVRGEGGRAGKGGGWEGGQGGRVGGRARGEGGRAGKGVFQNSHRSLTDTLLAQLSSGISLILLLVKPIFV